MEVPAVDPWFFEYYGALQLRTVNKTLHHGLLLIGPAGIGKYPFVLALAQGLLCQNPHVNGPCGKCQGCLLCAAGNHPDLLLVASEKQIGVDAIRQVSAKLTTTAQIGGNKVCMIYGAETMTEAASNALLKTLEEPTPNTYILLVASSHHKMLPTILSRTEKILLPVPSKADTKQWLAARTDKLIPDSLFELYGSAPYLLQSLLDQDSLPDMNNLVQQIKGLYQSGAEALTLAKKWENFAEILLSVCVGLTSKQYFSTLQSTDYQPYQYCLQGLAKLQQPGINKVLLLQSRLQSTSEAIKE